MSNSVVVSKIRPLLAQAHRQIKSLLADDKKANKFTAMALQVAQNPNIAKCTPESIVEALVGVAMLDLNPNQNFGQVYLIPYGNKVQLQVGYKGYITILDRAGYTVKAYPVYDVDEFEVETANNGAELLIKFKPNYDERDEGNPQWEYEHLRFAVAVIKDRVTGENYITVLSKKQIENTRKKSPNQKGDKPTGVWAEYYSDMAVKSVIKKGAKKLPLNDDRAINAVVVDDLAEIGKQIDYKETAKSGVVVVKEDEKTEEDIDINKMLTGGAENVKDDSE